MNAGLVREGTEARDRVVEGRVDVDRFRDQIFYLYHCQHM